MKMWICKLFIFGSTYHLTINKTQQNPMKKVPILNSSPLKLRLHVNLRTIDIPHYIIIENTDTLSAYEVLFDKITQHQYIKIDATTYLNTDHIIRIEIAREELLK